MTELHRHQQGHAHPADPDMGSVSARVIAAEVSAQPLDIDGFTAAVADPRCGALLSFVGIIRDHDEGRSVTGLNYEAHPDAPAVITSIAQQVAQAHPEVRVAVVHRVGEVHVGDPVLLAVAAAAHRKPAMAAIDELVEAVKARLPVWKYQLFADGSSEWVGALG